VAPAACLPENLLAIVGESHSKSIHLSRDSKGAPISVGDIKVAKLGAPTLLLDAPKCDAEPASCSSAPADAAWLAQPAPTEFLDDQRCDAELASCPSAPADAGWLAQLSEDAWHAPAPLLTTTAIVDPWSRPTLEAKWVASDPVLAHFTQSDLELSYGGALLECGAELVSAPVAIWMMHLTDPGLRLAPDAPTSLDAAAAFQGRQKQWLSELLGREDVVEVGAVSVGTHAEDTDSQLQSAAVRFARQRRKLCWHPFRDCWPSTSGAVRFARKFLTRY